MDAATLYLVVSLIGAGFTLSALVQARRLGPLVPIYFFAGWLTSELALFHVVWQALATLGFAAFGALGEGRGVVGLAVTFASWTGLLLAHRRSEPAGGIFERALREGLGDAYLTDIPADRAETLREGVPRELLLRPFALRDRAVRRVAGIEYGPEGKRNHLDVYYAPEGGEKRPVLYQIHGGAWVTSNYDSQAQPLMHHLAQRGWVCVSATYRLSPKARFPDHLIDVKKALAWVREHVSEFGGDPDFVCATGGSAGGHLSSLLGLTANEPEFQPGFEQVDTSVEGVVPFYGVYDFTDRDDLRGSNSMEPFLERTVMPRSRTKDPELWEKASPVSWVRPGLPPFFVIHGSHDTLAWVEDARSFVAALRERGDGVVAYAELPGAQHAFDIFHSVRSGESVNAVSRFLEWTYAGWRARGGRGSAAA